jgi:hypothetical protein
MIRSQYEIIALSKEAVYIIDLNNGGRSVTNDADNVYKEIQRGWPSKRVIYRDSMGRWDEIAMRDGAIVFLPYDISQQGNRSSLGTY